jgi:hypothetical protein
MITIKRLFKMFVDWFLSEKKDTSDLSSRARYNQTRELDEQLKTKKS